MADLNVTRSGMREQVGFLAANAKLLHYMNFVDCLNELRRVRPPVPSLQSLAMMQLSTMELEDFRYVLGEESWFVIDSTVGTNDIATSINTDDDYLSFEYVKCGSSVLSAVSIPSYLVLNNSSICGNNSCMTSSIISINSEANINKYYKTYKIHKSHSIIESIPPKRCRSV